MGDFTLAAGYQVSWYPTAVPLFDLDKDSVYEAMVMLPKAQAILYQYLNGDSLQNAETVPAACGVDTGGGSLVRALDVNQDLTLAPSVCLGTCTSCTQAQNDYATHWWNDAIFYELFVRSFYDSNGDGVGDFNGIKAKLDYLNDGDSTTTTDLGVTALWLMPIFSSPSYHGYDITNYKATQAAYGTVAEFDSLLAAAHKRGIKIILDMVLNHTSDQHPWFNASRQSKTSPKRDYYVWKESNPGFKGPWGQQVWFNSNPTNTYFYGLFGSGLPDLNWRSDSVKQAMFDNVRYWLNKGVDGYRLDAIKYLIEDSDTLESTPETLALLQDYHNVAKGVNPDAMSVGEAWSATDLIPQYVRSNRLDLCFEFDLASSIVGAIQQNNALPLRYQLGYVNDRYPKLQFGTFLTNHDQDRVMTVLSNNMTKMKQAASLYLTMPGAPFLYYGEEIGMTGSGADENKRRPMQWNTSAQAGFTTGRPWEAVNSGFQTANVQTMAGDPNSLLHHYKKLIALRKQQATLRKGYYLPANASNSNILAYARVWQNEAIVVASNFNAGSVFNASLSFGISTLPPGSYKVTDLFSGLGAGTVTVQADGSITIWKPSLPALAGNQTWILLLSNTFVAGTKESQLSFKPVVYPNPASGQINIQLSNGQPGAEVEVFTLLGQSVGVYPLQQGISSVTTKAWKSGAYFLRIKSGNLVHVERVIVE
jgi:glycosidase